MPTETGLVTPSTASSAIYSATLVSRRGGLTVKEFPRLIEAILSLAKELDAPGGGVKGEVRRDDVLVWSKATPNLGTVEELPEKIAPVRRGTPSRPYDCGA